MMVHEATHLGQVWYSPPLYQQNQKKVFWQKTLYHLYQFKLFGILTKDLQENKDRFMGFCQNIWQANQISGTGGGCTTPVPPLYQNSKIGDFRKISPLFGQVVQVVQVFSYNLFWRRRNEQ